MHKGVGKSKSVSRPGDNQNGFLRWRETDIPRQTPKFFKSVFGFFKHIPHFYGRDIASRTPRIQKKQAGNHLKYQKNLVRVCHVMLCQLQLKSNLEHIFLRRQHGGASSWAIVLYVKLFSRVSYFLWIYLYEFRTMFWVTRSLCNSLADYIIVFLLKCDCFCL